MNKRLFLLPLLAGFALSGCTINLFGQEIAIGEDDSSSSVKPKPTPTPTPTPTPSGGDEEEDHTPRLMEEFGDYKLAKEIHEGDYILGAYRWNEEIMRFANGDYHRDANGYYPFYMGTVGGTTEGAATVHVHFVNDDEFTMQLSCDASLPWNNKYIGVYAAESSFGNYVMSVGLLDDPYQEEYTDPKSGKVYKDKQAPKGIWKYYEELNDQKVYAPAAMYLYEDIDSEAVPKFLGTGHKSKQSLQREDDYTSFDCKSYEIATDGIQYDLAHLYELKAAE